MGEYAEPPDPITTKAHDLEEKRWFNKTLKLSDLEKFIAELKEKLSPDADPQIVVINHGTGRYDLHREAAVIGFVTRTEILETSFGEQLNENQGDEETAAHIEVEHEFQLRATGEVIYILDGGGLDQAPTGVYDV